jgi:hypothetical protein
MDSTPEDLSVNSKRYNRCSVIPLENCPNVENTSNETQENRPSRGFLKRNGLALCVSLIACIIAGVSKYLVSTVWFVDEEWNRVEIQICNNLGKQIVCDLLNIDCKNARENPENTNSSLSASVGCFNGTDCVFLPRVNCVYTAGYVPPSRSNFRFSAVTTIVITVVVRFWIERVFPSKWRDYILVLPLGWMLEIFFFLRGIASFEGSTFGTTYSGPVANISIALAANMIVHRLFISLRSKANDSRTVEKNSTHIRSSMIQRSLGQGQVQKIKGLSCGKLIMKNIHTVFVSTVSIGIVVLIIGLTVPGEFSFFSRDTAFFWIFCPTGELVERIFHDLWLLEENEFIEKSRVSVSANGPTDTESRIPLKLKIFRAVSISMSVIGTTIPGFLIPIDSPIPLPFVAFVMGIPYSRTFRNFKYQISQRKYVSQSRCKKIIIYVGRGIGLLSFITLLCIWQVFPSSLSRDTSQGNLENHSLAESFLWGILPTTAVLAALPVFFFGIIIYRRLESGKRGKLLLFFSFLAYYPIMISTAVIYAVSRIHYFGKDNGSLAAGKTVLYTAIGACIFLHRSVSISTFFSEEILVNPLSTLFAGATLSWFLGVQPFDSFLGPPITSGMTT